MKGTASSWLWYLSYTSPSDYTELQMKYILPYRHSVIAPFVAEQVAKRIACGELETKIPALVTIQSFTRMLLAKRKAVMLTKRKPMNCLNGERDANSLQTQTNIIPLF